ncbi:hypothetical protein QCA50_017424 [Cerrena zonata]|uniref:FACT complex subunit n=1 Tax=Cerrena zonata TaxID=2478898 RepID=A0AAW0FD86_9APHY
MSDVKIDTNIFHKRLSILQKNLTADSSKYSSLLFLVGARDDESTYKKSTVLQIWLLGYEFAHTSMLITQDKCFIITSEGKAKYLKQLPNKPTNNSSDVEIWTRTKDTEKNKQLFKDLIGKLKEVGSEEQKIGTIIKDQYKGKFIDEWNEVSKEDNLQYLDASLLVSKSLELKDSDEFNNTKTAAKSSVVMMDTFANEMMVVVDEELKTKNSDLSDKIEDHITKTLLKDGKVASEVYQGATDFIKKERPDLLDHFTKNF